MSALDGLSDALDLLRAALRGRLHAEADAEDAQGGIIACLFEDERVRLFGADAMLAAARGPRRHVLLRGVRFAS